MEGVPTPNSASVGHRKALSLGRVARSTSVIGNLVCVVSLPLEDEWMPPGATIRQPGVDDEDKSIYFLGTQQEQLELVQKGTKPSRMNLLELAVIPIISSRPIGGLVYTYAPSKILPKYFHIPQWLPC